MIYLTCPCAYINGLMFSRSILLIISLLQVDNLLVLLVISLNKLSETTPLLSVAFNFQEK